MTTNTKLKSLILFFLVIPVITYSQVRLPKLISNGTVLQRDANIRIWG
jgi:sialate O-acetylesterase